MIELLIASAGIIAFLLGCLIAGVTTTTEWEDEEAIFFLGMCICVMCFSVAITRAMILWK